MKHVIVLSNFKISLMNRLFTLYDIFSLYTKNKIKITLHIVSTCIYSTCFIWEPISTQVVMD